MSASVRLARAFGSWSKHRLISLTSAPDCRRSTTSRHKLAARKSRRFSTNWRRTMRFRSIRNRARSACRSAIAALDPADEAPSLNAAIQSHDIVGHPRLGGALILRPFSEEAPQAGQVDHPAHRCRAFQPLQFAFHFAFAGRQAAIPGNSGRAAPPLVIDFARQAIGKYGAGKGARNAVAPVYRLGNRKREFQQAPVGMGVAQIQGAAVVEPSIAVIVRRLIVEQELRAMLDRALAVQLR